MTQDNCVLVLGSKPEARLPDITPDCIYSANGAAERLNHYSKCRKIAVVSSQMSRDEVIRQKIKDANPDLIVVRSHENQCSSSLDSFGIELKNLSGLMMSSIEQEAFGYLTVLRALLIHFSDRGLWKGPRLMLSHVNNRYKTFACSTGLFAIAYASLNHPTASLYVAGIGLKAGEHFYGQGSFQSLTARKDYLIASEAIAKRAALNARLFTTDSTLAKVARINLC